MILYLLLVLSCTALSLLPMDPVALWCAAQQTNKNWHQIISSVSSADSVSRQNVKADQGNLDTPRTHEQTTVHHEQK